MIKCRIVAICSVALLLADCATTKIESSKADTHGKVIDSIYVVLALGQGMPDFNESVKHRFKNGFEHHGIKATVKLLREWWADSDLAAKEAKQYGCNYLLIVTNKVSTGAAAMVLLLPPGSREPREQPARQLGGVYDLSILDATNKQTIWQGKEELVELVGASCRTLTKPKGW